MVLSRARIEPVAAHISKRDALTSSVFMRNYEKLNRHRGILLSVLNGRFSGRT